MVKITQIAEQLLERQFNRTAEPTQYIAGFRTTRGRELALQRNWDSIYLWTEHLAELPQQLTLRPLRHYPNDKSRSSNLNHKNAPRLRVGKAVDYWQLTSTEELQSLVEWYKQQ